MGISRPDWKQFAGLVLAGGRSQRMGSDKAKLRIGGLTFLDRARQTLAACSGRCLVSGRDGVVDPVSGFGPAAGIIAGLRSLENETALLVLACDLPLMTSDMLKRLGELNHAQGIAVHAFYDARTEKLEMAAALYWREALPFFEQALKEDRRKLREIVPAQKIRRIPYQANDAWQFLNCNTPADLRKARRLAKRSGQ